MEMFEAVHTPDVFASGLGEIECLGSGILRLTFYVVEKHGDERQMVVVARIVTTKAGITALQEAIQQKLTRCCPVRAPAKGMH